MEELDNIQDHIYIIRGYRVMLDFDLAKLYEVKTKALNQAVKRNPKRFEGEEYMFQLSKSEWISFTKSARDIISDETNDNSFSDDYNLRSQIVTSRFSDNWGGIRGCNTSKPQDYESLCRLSPFGRIAPSSYISRSEKTN